MTLKWADRVGTISTTNGTGQLTLGAALDTFQDFSIVGNNNTCYYSLVSRDEDEWEVGLGTVSYAAPFWYIARTSVIDGSDGLATAVSLNSGTKEVKLVYPSTYVSTAAEQVAAVASIAAVVCLQASYVSANTALTFVYKTSAQAAAVSAQAAATSADVAASIAIVQATSATAQASIATVAAVCATTQASIAGVYASIAQAAVSGIVGSNASFIVMSATPSLANSRRLVGSSFIVVTDGGAGTTVSIDANVSAFDGRYYLLTSGQALTSVVSIQGTAITSIGTALVSIDSALTSVQANITSINAAVPRLAAVNTFTNLNTFTSVTTFSANVSSANIFNVGGILFTGATTTLANYEEGSWTPVLAGGTTPGTQVYATQVGRYIRVGNEVWISGTLALTSIDGATVGNVLITGLPFTISNITGLIGAASFTRIGGFTLQATYTGLGFGMTANQTRLVLTEWNPVGGAVMGLLIGELAQNANMCFTGVFRTG